jgi:hypothetical protein
MIIATQYGAVPISEHYAPAQSSDPSGQSAALSPFKSDLTFELAQLNPSPVPPGFNP